jgi:hypothetical protein
LATARSVSDRSFFRLDGECAADLPESEGYDPNHSIELLIQE